MLQLSPAWLLRGRRNKSMIIQQAGNHSQTEICFVYNGHHSLCQELAWLAQYFHIKLQFVNSVFSLRKVLE